MTMADISFTETGETKQTAEYSLKTPPQSIEAEQSVLGGLMLENQRWCVTRWLRGRGNAA